MRIIHPHPVLGSQTFIGVEFSDGFAVVDSLHPEVEAALIQHGFTFEAATPPSKPSKRSGRGKSVKAEKASESGISEWAEPESSGETYIPLKPVER